MLRFRSAFAIPSFVSATLTEVMKTFPSMVLNLGIKLTVPNVKPYEGLFAGLPAEYERSDDVLVASFLDHSTEPSRKRRWGCRSHRARCRWLLSPDGEG